MAAGSEASANVVVGGASGIGAAVAARHRQRGEPVVVWDIAGDRDLTCDVADPGAVEDAAATTVECHGTPRRVTITAGTGHAGLLADATADEWDRVVGTNARGAWLVMRALANRMRRAAVTGSVVVTSSVSARIPDHGMGLYCASKAALDMVTRVAAVEWAPDIVVNAVSPGVTETAMLGGAPTDSGWLAGVRARTPSGRLGQPDDIAAAILAVHDLGWVTGQVLECDGGLGLASPIDPFGVAGQPARES